MLRFASLALLLPLLLLAATGVVANPVVKIRVIGDQDRTRFIVDMNEAPTFGVVHLADPHRLVIDMPGVEFPDANLAEKGRGLVRDFRYGLIAPGRARIVLDLSGPTEVAKSFVLDPVGEEPARLVLDLVPVDEAAFRAIVAEDRPNYAALPASADQPAAPETDDPVVVIDPGHGGIDSGAVGPDGALEKDLTLRFAKALAARLRAGGKVEPVLTRDGDAFLSLTGRVALARRHEAALFISVHADIVREDYVRGATVYTLSEDASDSLAAALAARENRSDILAGLALQDQPDDVADILFDLARRETKNLSVRFAKDLVAKLDGEMELNKSPWRRAAFMVLKAPDVPSVLFELGYLSNPDDEKLLAEQDWLEARADTVGGAIEDFLARNLSMGQ